MSDWNEITPVFWPPAWQDDDGFPTEPAENLEQQRKRQGVCPKCGDRGQWINLGLFCKLHGQFAG